MSSAINLKLGARKPAQTGKPEASAMEMERRIIWVRWLAILVSLGALPFLSTSLNRQSLWTLAGLIGLGAIYNLTLLVIILPRKPGWLTSGYISAIGDTLLVTGGVAVTGGLDSPFFLAYFVVTVTTAVRFGGLAAIVAVLTIALSYTAVVYYDNAVAGTSLKLNPDLINLALRTGFVAITGIFVGFVGDRARRAERALEEELERAHASLSEVTVELNRDLEFEQTCLLAAEKGRLLLNADAFLLQVQMPPLIGQDESAPPASTLYIDWNPELKAQYASVDMTGARLSLTPAMGEQVITITDPNIVLPENLKAMPAGLWYRVPVFHGARAIADMIIGFQSRTEPLRQTEQELMLTFAERAGIAMRNAHALDQAQKLSVTDSVTGLPNHRYFHTRFDEELENTKDTGGSITVMMIDLDRFKVYNDSFGHAAGDVALKAAARTISSTMRREDTVTRYGGEEFVAILPGVDIQTAPLRAQEICDTLAKVFMYNPKTIFAPLTASVGWATYPVDAKNRDELLNRADLAMYMAKKRGRNCICGACELESVAALDSVLSEVVAQLASADTVGPGMVATLEKRLGQIANSSHLEELAEGMLSPNSEATLEALNALAASIDAKDPYTSGHSQSVAKLAEDLGDMLQLSPAHKNQLRLAAILHDVGKIGVVDKVLLKEGKLDEDEKLIMRMHPILGARILQPIKAFRQILNVVLHHHEWYDGSGYPDGLAGQNIPLHARIVSVCDAYHAMTSTRPYRQRRTPEFALAQLEAGKGTQFDPIIVDYFIQMMRKRQAENPDALEADVHDDHPSPPEVAAAS
ncbi:MAG: diguanylate cyclase [Chloroflexota bacterium]|nr:MAG: diguanylate cyclase [Chloroflexota bacterium]TMD88145.1 MAG: diguanylate cyclase [Chloroflexota bacterium]